MEHLITASKMTLTVFRSFFYEYIFKRHVNIVILMFLFELPNLNMFLVCSYYLPVLTSLFLKICSYIKKCIFTKRSKLDAWPGSEDASAGSTNSNRYISLTPSKDGIILISYLQV